VESGFSRIHLAVVLSLWNPASAGFGSAFGDVESGFSRILQRNVSRHHRPDPVTQGRTPMLSGAHVIVYSKDAEADRAFFRDVLRFASVDAGQGWLIFALPPSEVAVHPADANDRHEFYLVCDDVKAFVAEMKARGVRCGPVQDRGWGLLTELTLPGGGRLGVYQPRHPRPA
jgi:hypothetical protein